MVYAHRTLKSGASYLNAAVQYSGTVVNLVVAGCAQANASGSASVGVTPGAKTVNLVVAACSQSSTSGTASIDVSTAAKTVSLVVAACSQAAQSGSALVSVISASAPATSVLVPASRTAKFAGRSRVVVFNGTKPASYSKGPLDELYVVGDVSKDLLEASTTIASVAYDSAGITILEGPYLQSGFPVVKLGAFDMSKQRWFFTFRLTLENGEQIDRTIELTVVDDRTKVFGKDPDDKRFYTFDFSSDATFGGSALSTVSGLEAVGVTSLQVPGRQGNAATVKVGGLDTADNAANSIALWANFANTERIFRTVYFSAEEH